VRQLGRRLRDGKAQPSDPLLRDLLSYYDEARAAAERTVIETAINFPVNVSVTGRTKTVPTIIEKLQREPTMNLAAMRDIAGVRVVGALALTQQDEFATALVERLEPDSSPELVDRRAEPSAGYRALHLEIKLLDVPAEIQIRTHLQALWADTYERLADAWGRQIRYGGPPDAASDDAATTQRQAFVERLQQLSERFAMTEGVRDSHFRTQRDVEALNLEGEVIRLQRRRTRAALQRQTRIRADIADMKRRDEDMAGDFALLEGVFAAQLKQVLKSAQTLT
jgi:ppGpp synthetase/RelA/SpoT-type nucleotidyltranferase